MIRPSYGWYLCQIKTFAKQRLFTNHVTCTINSITLICRKETVHTFEYLNGRFSGIFSLHFLYLTGGYSDIVPQVPRQHADLRHLSTSACTKLFSMDVLKDSICEGPTSNTVNMDSNTSIIEGASSEVPNNTSANIKVSQAATVVDMSDSLKTYHKKLKLKTTVLQPSLLQQVCAFVRENRHDDQNENDRSKLTIESEHKESSSPVIKQSEENNLDMETNLKDDKICVNTSALLSLQTEDLLGKQMQCDTNSSKSKLEHDSSNTCDISDVFDQAYKHSVRDSKKAQKRAKNRKRKYDVTNTEAGTETEGQPTKPKHTRPNYFMAVQVTNAKIHQRLNTVQEHILNRESALKTAMIPLSTLHLTLMVMHLANDEDIERAKQVMHVCKQQVGDMLNEAIVLNVEGIGTFGNKVVFAQVRADDALDKLTQIADTVEKCFADAGIKSDGKGFEPHITVLKLSKAKPQILKKAGIRKIDPCLYSVFQKQQFGSQLAESLQLCSMLKGKDSQGYYHVEHAESFISSELKMPGSNSVLTFPHTGDAPESVYSRQIVASAVTSAIGEINIEECAMKNLYQDPRTWTDEFEKEIKWNFTKGDSPSAHPEEKVPHADTEICNIVNTDDKD